MLRIRPTRESVVASHTEVPYEIHLVRFQSDEDFAAFATDPGRERFLHLKNESVRAALLIKGAAEGERP